MEGILITFRVKRNGVTRLPPSLSRCRPTRMHGLRYPWNAVSSESGRKDGILAVKNMDVIVRLN